MSSNDEMYERGSEDAAHDDLNPFYYQHYYHYRRGYNSARRHLRQQRSPDGSGVPNQLWLVGLILAILSSVGIFLWLGLSAGRSRADRSSAPTNAIASTVSLAESMPPTPTFPPLPSPLPALILQVGGRARIVNVGDSPLLAHQEPGISTPVQVRLPLNTEVTILSGPVEADGYIWWQVENDQGRGWSAERSVDGLLWLEPLPAGP